METILLLELPNTQPLLHEFAYYLCIMKNITEVKKTIAERIIQARSKATPPLAANELAHITGVNKSTISRIETGKLMPSVETLLLICNALNIKISELMAGISLQAEENEHE